MVKLDTVKTIATDSEVKLLCCTIVVGDVHRLSILFNKGQIAFVGFYNMPKAEKHALGIIVLIKLN